VLAEQRHHLAAGREHGHELEYLEDPAAAAAASAAAASAAVGNLGRRPAPIGGRPEQRPESGAVDERRHWRGRSIDRVGAAQHSLVTFL